jgi:hypothetical protein
MEETMRLDDYLVEAVYTDMEVNFTVLDSEGYCCRLVPGPAGFELSKLDRALGIDPGENLVNRIGSFIVSYYS